MIGCDQTLETDAEPDQSARDVQDMALEELVITLQAQIGILTERIARLERIPVSPVPSTNTSGADFLLGIKARIAADQARADSWRIEQNRRRLQTLEYQQQYNAYQSWLSR